MPIISISETCSIQPFPSPNPQKKKKKKRRGKPCPRMDMLLQRRNSYCCIVLFCNKCLQVMFRSQHFGSKRCSLPTSPLFFGRLYRLRDPWGHRQLIMTAIPCIYNPSKNSASHQPNQELKVGAMKISLITLFLNIRKWP